MKFDAETRAILEGDSFATLSTLQPDGSPQVTMMWFRVADDHVRMIAPENARKVVNLARDPRCTIVVFNAGNSYRYVELRGTADIVHDDAAARQELRYIARRYIGDRADGYVESLSESPRVIIVITLRRVRSHFGTPPAST